MKMKMYIPSRFFLLEKKNVHLGCTFFSLTQWKAAAAFVFEFRYVIIDQLYDKFSITKPIKLDLSDRLQNQRFWSDQRLWTGVCVFAGYLYYIKKK